MQALVEPLVRWRTKTDDIEDWERVWRIDPSSVAITRTHRSDFRQRQLMITRDGERLGTFGVKPAA